MSCDIQLWVSFVCNFQPDEEFLAQNVTQFSNFVRNIALKLFWCFFILLINLFYRITMFKEQKKPSRYRCWIVLLLVTDFQIVVLVCIWHTKTVSSSVLRVLFESE